jgi:hypothetical protein
MKTEYKNRQDSTKTATESLKFFGFFFWFWSFDRRMHTYEKRKLEITHPSKSKKSGGIVKES